MATSRMTVIEAAEDIVRRKDVAAVGFGSALALLGHRMMIAGGMGVLGGFGLMLTMILAIAGAGLAVAGLLAVVLGALLRIAAWLFSAKVRQGEIDA